MTAEILILFSSILLLSYILDLSSKYTKIPTVIWLLAMGWGLHQVSLMSHIQIPKLDPILPIFGTIGLILIVLEGSLDLKLSKQSIPLVRSAFIMSILPFVFFTMALTLWFYVFNHHSLQSSILNSIPFAIISSAIAIPSVKNYQQKIRTFITYESSISDIIGVLVFNFVLITKVYNLGSILGFFSQIGLVVISSIILTTLLSLLLSRMSHHVKYGPILLFILLVYGLSKFWHLPGLIFILIFGLALNNLELFRNSRFAHFFKPEKITKEIKQFSDIVAEATFLIRSLFFVLFGFMIKTQDLLDWHTWPLSIGIIGLLLGIRYFFLLMTKQNLSPYLFVAPRGLITILLYLSIPITLQIPSVNNALIIQVILLSIAVMMIGLITYKDKTMNVD